MSVYSRDAVNTLYLDPVITSSSRVEFRINEVNSYILPNLSLLEVGATSGSPVGYNKLNGTSSIIKELYLYDGKTELSSNQHCNLWNAWNMVNNTNSYNNNYNGAVNGTGAKHNTMFRNLVCNTTGLKSQGQVGELRLNSLLPILDSLSCIPTAIMSNLRLVVVFNTNKNEVFNADANTITAKSNMLLKVDVINSDKGADMIKESMAKFGSPINWLEIEHDEFHLADAGNNDNVEVQTKKKVNGFNNKSVRKALMIKQHSVNADLINGGNVIGFGNVASAGFYKGKYNVEVNGVPMFPQNGIESDNERLGMLCDLYGNISTIPWGNSASQYNTGTTADYFCANSQGQEGQLDYVPLPINQTVNDLQIQINRTTLNDARTYKPNQQAMRVHIFGEVSKSLVVEGGDYNIVYN